MTSFNKSWLGNQVVEEIEVEAAISSSKLELDNKFLVIHDV
jgi:hypothetical protein